MIPLGWEAGNDKSPIHTKHDHAALRVMGNVEYHCNEMMSRNDESRSVSRHWAVGDRMCAFVRNFVSIISQLLFLMIFILYSLLFYSLHARTFLQHLYEVEGSILCSFIFHLSTCQAGSEFQLALVVRVTLSGLRNQSSLWAAGIPALYWKLSKSNTSQQHRTPTHP